MSDKTLPESEEKPAPDAEAVSTILPESEAPVKGEDPAPVETPEVVAIESFLDSPELAAPEGDAPAPIAQSSETNAPADISKQQGTIDGVKYNLDGSIRKKRGRKPGSTNTPAQINASAPQIEVDVIGSAQATVDAATGSLAMLLGPEWHPEKMERDNLVAATANYYKSKNMADIPPGVLLGIVVFGYSMSRMQNENTSTKLKVFTIRAWTGIKNLTGLFGRK